MDRKKLRERIARAAPYLLALLTAVLLRIFVDNFNDTGRRIEVPLAVRSVPAGCSVEGLPSRVSVKLVGYKNALEEPGIDTRLSAWVDLSHASAGTNAASVRVGGSRLPFNVNIVSVDPVRVRFLLFCATNTNAGGAR